MIFGIGTDIVSYARIEEIYKNFGNNFCDRILTNFEKEIFNSKKDKIAYLAKRFAAKEAVAKALGTGIGKVSFKDIEILNDKNGKPFVNINNFEQYNFNISIADEKKRYAVAFCVISEKT